MRKVERITSVKNELLDIFMSINVDEHEKRSRSAAQRNLRARRGIELHNEFKQLERNIADLNDDETH
ncbi:PA3496 family putative envelope integrity protein [Billgrantia sp. LNSP4103-1]|uniref:PA3496 family putative envelope integrity protein n=1 Tax=Billgrantia sp. LNSP4103-1 TaxID=3410266 RepID=UPI00403F0E4E